jgi:hypothetical protein
MWLRFYIGAEHSWRMPEPTGLTNSEFLRGNAKCIVARGEA